MKYRARNMFYTCTYAYVSFEPDTQNAEAATCTFAHADLNLS